MLYIDQPVQAGFSYDTLINGTLDETVSPFKVTPLDPAKPPQLNFTTIPGVFPSGSPKTSVNTTEAAAQAAWHFMQTWLKE
jgi:hypothetical protein